MKIIGRIVFSLKLCLLSACSVLIGLVALELGIRYAGAYNPDGNFIIYGRVLKPFHLPIRVTRQEAEIYRTSNQTRLMYDPYLGWAPRPNYRSANGLYAYNAQGIRTDAAAPAEYSTSPPSHTFRIIIVGDSFTHGDEITYTDTWGYRLEKKLKKAGVEAEVINLGVGAYGLDQAFLRWQKVGRALAPRLVILGLQMENSQRNVNLIRPLYLPNTGLPFSKPRYVLKDNRLALINMPPLPPDDLPAVLENLSTWDLAAYEYFLRPTDYREQPWQQSKLAALLQEIIAPVETEPFFYDLNKEPAQLTLAIIKTFKNEAEANGSSFLIVHIPIALDLIHLSLGQNLVYTDLLATIEADTMVIHTPEALLKKSNLPSLFTPGGHYTAAGNEAIAETITAYLLNERMMAGQRGRE